MKLPPPVFPKGVNIRPAKRVDGPAILRLVEGLAEYEKLPPPDPGAQQRLLRDMFSTPPRIEGFLGEIEGVPVGYSFVFESYSSFLALPTLYLEDIFVLPEYRGRKVGVTMFTYLVHEAWRRGCGRLEWMVLDWNKPAIEFYKKLGATHMHQWQLFRLVRTEMESFLAPR